MLLLTLLESAEKPSSSRKDMRTSGGDHNSKLQIKFEARVVGWVPDEIYDMTGVQARRVTYDRYPGLIL